LVASTKKGARHGRLLLAKLVPDHAGLLQAITTAELIDPAAGIDDFLLPGIKGVALRAHFDMKIMPDGGTSNETAATAAGDIDFFVIRMDFGAHVNTSTLQKQISHDGLQESNIIPKPEASRQALVGAYKIRALGAAQ
jgi:hypothetical protein